MIPLFKTKQKNISSIALFYFILFFRFFSIIINFNQKNKKKIVREFIILRKEKLFRLKNYMI